MPSNKISTMGGQRRTITLPCDKVIQGHPDRINTIIRLHHKKCDICRDITPFNSQAVDFEGDLNATNFKGGVSYDAQRPALLRSINDASGVSTLHKSECKMAGSLSHDVEAKQPMCEMPSKVAKKRNKKKKNKKRFG